MSIFDRLISTLTGNEEAAAPAPAKTPSPEPEGDGKRSRFMGREGAESASEPVVVEKGLEGPSMIWLHVQPATQRLLLVPDLGVAEGEELTGKMTEDLRRAGLCEAVAYHAGYDQYWKMPSQEAILRTPSLYEIPTPLLNRIKLETRLVKQGEPRGFWMHVRIRSAQELQGGAA
ncbi:MULTISPECIES: hypothetical protein [Comamonas]|uniref:hypothetical protein n=1 Tax=Comamonas TaxID=283 RepID=UPI00158163D3|nr:MULTISPECIES: hypothetical protein [Comamonas]QXW18933.1 hypothetical protein KXJ72_02990 [Comamonas aquatica]